MPGPLLATKLHVPRRRLGLVPRPRLSAHLARGAGAVLTLVSAPAGFGKTTLLTDWLADGRRVAWVSLDQRDDDPAVFWTYVLSAVQAATGGAGAAALALLQASHASIDEALDTLVNELDAVAGDLDAVAGDLVLVLDDYHVVESAVVHDRMALLLEHLPRHVQVVIATRADPALPLARWRARGELVEVRADDLRFTTGEASSYLDEATGGALTGEHVAALESRTEGWIAALQLAALSMRGREDVTGFIAGFAGDDRFVVDYLVEEVLQRQPDEVRSFLLQTSILSRLSAGLAEAVTGQHGGRAMLEALERGNLFVVPLDDRRQWYRYHHLFADMLHARLLDEFRERVAGLHRRASDWYERAGEPSEAIRHALAAGDPERAADLVELAMPAARQNRQETTLRHWLRQLPEAVIRERPLLSAGYAGAILIHGELDGVEEHLGDAERWLAASVAPGSAVDDDLVREVRGQVAVYRAALCRVSGDMAGAMTHARAVLDLVAADQHLLRGSAAGLLGLALWSGGDLEAAHRSWSDSRHHLEQAGHRSDSLGVALALADIRIAQGQLRDATATYEHGLSTALGPAVLRGAADMHVGLSELYRERGDLASAREHLAASAELGEHAGLPQNRHRWRIAQARLREAEGDLDGAVDLLDEAERVYVSDMFPDVRPIGALRARVRVAQGRVGQALEWAGERGLTAGDELSYLREFEHITLARALLAGPSPTDAIPLLERLLRAAEDGGRAGSALEVLVLQALAHRAAGDLPRAVVVLARALAIAEPEGYVRLFVDEGPPMAALLRACAHGDAAVYAQRLLAAFTTTHARTVLPVQRGPVGPLSSRELDVLRLLGSDLGGPAIARELFVSLNTLRTHTRNIYAKLGVNSRREALRRAAELDLR